MCARVDYPLNRNHLIYGHFSIESRFFSLSNIVLRGKVYITYGMIISWGFFFWRTIFTFPAFIERLSKNVMFECIGKNGVQHANGLLFIVNIGPMRKVCFFMRRHSTFLAIENSRFMNMCYMWLFACDKNRTVWFVWRREKKAARTWIEHVNLCTYSSPMNNYNIEWHFVHSIVFSIIRSCFSGCFWAHNSVLSVVMKLQTNRANNKTHISAFQHWILLDAFT